jgi:hypothetical protein
MGAEGRQLASDLDWRWRNTSGQCDVWLGRMEAGVYLKLKGDGSRWDSPDYGLDYPIIPAVPPTWGGVAARNGDYGVNVSAPAGSSPAELLVFTGARQLQSGAAVVFRFDLMFTPSKPLNLSDHWRDRYFQVRTHAHSCCAPFIRDADAALPQCGYE